MLTTIIVVVVLGIGASIWSILTTRRRRREELHDQALREFRKDGKNAGLAIAAATITHILERGSEVGADFKDITHRISTITSRWAEYDAEAYKAQKQSLTARRQGTKILAGHRTDGPVLGKSFDELNKE